MEDLEEDPEIALLMKLRSTLDVMNSLFETALRDLEVLSQRYERLADTSTRSPRPPFVLRYNPDVVPIG